MRAGRPPRLTVELAQMIIALQRKHNGRAAERELCALMGEKGHIIAPSTMHKWCKVLGMRRFKRPLRPKLTEAHRIARMEYVLDELVRGPDEEPRLFGDEYRFHGLDQFVHVDEKWFYLKKDKQTIRLFPAPDGSYELPVESVYHKSRMPKVMFLAAVAMPRPDYGFDGKLGIWPFVRYREAKRSDKRTGTRKGETVIMESVTVDAESYRKVILGKDGVMDMIRAKMWWFEKGSGKKEAGLPIFLQQDGARPHTANAKHFKRLGPQKGFDIQVVTQPAQSPDFNWNDLSFFRSLQTEVEFHILQTPQAILETVQHAFESYEPERLTVCCLSLVTTWRGCLEDGGGNGYKSHAGLRKEARKGAVSLGVPRAVVEKARALVELRGAECGQEAEAGARDQTESG